MSDPDPALAAHVRILGRGPGRSRSLTMVEAQDAMRLMLAGADPHAVGALLMLLRMKGETAEEIAGLAQAAQAAVGPRPLGRTMTDGSGACDPGATVDGPAVDRVGTSGVGTSGVGTSGVGMSGGGGPSSGHVAAGDGPGVDLVRLDPAHLDPARRDPAHLDPARRDPAQADPARATLPPVDLDWPSYAAGRTRGLPWFLLAARLVANSGRRVLIHGWNGPDAAVRQGVATLGIAVATTPEQAKAALARDCLVYMPLEHMHPALFALLSLRGVLGLRSGVNTVCRMLNPGRAPASVQGVFHPSYRLLQADAAQLLGWRALSVIKGGGGEFERHPGKLVEGFGLRCGTPWQDDLPALIDDGMRLADLDLPQTALTDLWDRDTGPDFARQMVLGTAQLALDTLGDTSCVESLWHRRTCGAR